MLCLEQGGQLVKLVPLRHDLHTRGGQGRGGRGPFRLAVHRVQACVVQGARVQGVDQSSHLYKVVSITIYYFKISFPSLFNVGGLDFVCFVAGWRLQLFRVSGLVLL